MKNTILLITILSCVSITHAQKPELKRIQVGDFYIYSGAHSGGFDVTFDELLKLTSKSDLLNGDLSDYTISNSYSSSSGNFLSAKLGLNFLNKGRDGYKQNPQLQIGFTYQTNSLIDYGLWKKERVRVDTLSSTTTSNIMYIDSTFNSNINAHYKSDNFLIDVALLYTTDNEARWSLYGGFGVVAGISIKAHTEIFENHYESLQYSLTGNQNEYNLSRSTANGNSYEKQQNKMNYLGWAQLPLGISFRVAKNTRLWKNLNLFYEVTPMIKYLSVPEIGGFVSTGIKHGFGLKVNVR